MRHLPSSLTPLITLSLIGIFSMCSTGSIADKGVLQKEKISALIEQGEYIAATQSMQNLLKQNVLTSTEQDYYAFEIERLDRVSKDFSASKADVIAYIQKYYPELSETDLDRWEASKALESRVINGNKRYFARAARNLFRIDAEMVSIWNDQHPEEEITSGSGARLDLNVHIASIIQSTQESNKIYAEPQHISIKQSVVVDADAVPSGENLKCWIPYPRAIQNRQEDIRLIESIPKSHILAPENVLQRTIYMEKLAVAGEATLFSVEYQFTSHGIFHDINPDLVTTPDSTADLEPFLQEEAPHIVFSPALRELSERIIGNETNPYRKAQLLFQWIDEHTPWASAREYSTIRCIPQYAYENGHGDCGIQTLFFITLCRMNGIPARWQSGWELQPPDNSMHDWGMIYFKPYGWVPMDVTYGLRKNDDPGVRWFYLGGMDSYRIIFNDGFSQAFVPEKTYFRSETIDSQRGEVEWSGGNLYFDQWDWEFEWKILK